VAGASADPNATAGPFEGYVDADTSDWLSGWVWDRQRPNEPIAIEVYVDGRRAATAVADLYRPDLEAAGKGDGRHAFRIPLPPLLADGGAHGVEVRAAESGASLPRSGSAPPAAVPAGGGLEAWGRSHAGARYHSRFGGLWTDLANAPDVIRGKRALGWISEAEAEALRRWVEDGFVVLEQAVPPEALDRLDRDVEDIWNGTSHAPCFVATSEGGTPTLERAGPRFKDERTRLLDLHAHLDSARNVVFAAPIVRFLTLVFERPALAFQSLYFRWGSRQAVHQDTAFVKVSSPLEFAASWIALEDVRPGSGALEYFVGSHRLEDHVFPDGRRWLPDRASEQPYLDALTRRSEERGLRKQRFLARRGDVLIWSADLAHGGAADVAEGVTRKSIVTHYCPLGCAPVYSGQGPKRAPVRYADGASYTWDDRGIV
jgi:phytanoyl-CoA hydroxylase